jgi:hypothetical protein
MPNGVTPRITVVLISLAFSVTFGLQALGSSPAPKAAAQPARASSAEPPGPRPDLTLTAHAVPALKDPRVPHVRKPKRKKRHVVAAAPKPAPVRVVSTPDPTPAATPRPRPKPKPAAPRYVPTPAPRYVPPRRTPAPTPQAKPVPSGEFDTSGTP